MTKEYALAVCQDKIKVNYNGEHSPSTIEFPSDQILRPNTMLLCLIDKELAEAIKVLLNK